MSYQPRPLPTAGIALPSELSALIERLAEHVHDVWASRRLEQGWTWGPHRDDEERTHPGLVPYAELSESEKEYDRQTALQVIRALLATGCRIIPPDRETR